MSLPMRTSRISGPRHLEPLGPLDRRVNAWRDDLADVALAGLVAVPHYATPAPHEVLQQTPLLSAPDDGAVAVSELLPGEPFAVLDSGHGFAWGYAGKDHYVGYVALDALAPAGPAPNGQVGPGDALLFRSASIKAAVVATLPVGALLDWVDHDAQFVRLTRGPHAGCFLHRRHLLPTGGDSALDWVSVALSFVGAPYRWGGRSRAGIDCSGLIQIARQTAGLPCRRDSDMQFADLSEEVPQGEGRRGDIAWWPGHIGILLDRDTLLRANAHWMACRIEPLADVIARAGAGSGPAQPRLRRP